MNLTQSRWPLLSALSYLKKVSETREKWGGGGIPFTSNGKLESCRAVYCTPRSHFWIVPSPLPPSFGPASQTLPPCKELPVTSQHSHCSSWEKALGKGAQCLRKAQLTRVHVRVSDQQVCSGKEGGNKQDFSGACFQYYPPT